MYTDIRLSIEEKEDRKNSFYLSVAIHLILLLMLLMIPMKKAITPDPTLQGIVVQFGNPNAGNENSVNEPMIAEASKSEEKNEEKAEAELEKKTEAPAAKKETPAPVKVETKLVEKTSPIIASEEVVIEKQTKVVEANNSSSSSSNQEKTNEKSEAEKLEESKAKFGSLFGGGSTGSENDKKGEDFGVPDATALEGLSKGTGQAGDGLGSRGLVYEPKIEDKSQKSGKVVVKVCVNKQGNVTSAKYTQRGSSTADSYLISLAEKSAKKYRFTPSNTDEQCGSITIDFIVK